MENNNFNQKTNVLTALVIALSALVIILVGAFAYMYFNDSINNGDNKPVIDNNENQSGQVSGETVKDLSLDDPIVKELSDKVIGVYTNNYMSDYMDYFYKKEKITLADENISFKLSLSAESISDLFKTIRDGYDCKNGACGVSYIDETSLKNAYYEIFGNEAEYYRSSFKVGGCAGEYKWSDINKRYEAEIPDGCGGTTCGGAEQKLAYAKKVTSDGVNKIEIYEYFSYLVCSEAGVDGGSYYADYNKTNFIGVLDREELFKKHSDKLGMYKYTFVEDSDGNYVFTSVEKVK